MGLTQNDNAGKEAKSMKNETSIRVDVDVSDLNETIEKANQLVSLLQEANTLADSLFHTTGGLTVSVIQK